MIYAPLLLAIVNAINFKVIQLRLSDLWKLDTALLGAFDHFH